MPAGTHTINTEPIQDRSYTNKHNTNIVVWRIGLEGAESVAPDKLFELHKREGNVPQRGDTLEVERHFEGTDNQGAPFTRLYVASGQSGGGGYSGGGKSDGPGLQWASKPFERGAEHPRNEVRMIHTSALSAAPGYINQALAFGVIEAPKDEDAYWALVGHVVTRLAKSYYHPLSATEGQQTAAQQPLNGGGGEVPADTEGLGNGSAATPSDERIPF